MLFGAILIKYCLHNGYLLEGDCGTHKYKKFKHWLLNTLRQKFSVSSNTLHNGSTVCWLNFLKAVIPCQLENWLKFRATAVQRWCLATDKNASKMFTYVKPVVGLNMNFTIFQIYLKPVTTHMLLAFCYITTWKHAVFTYHSETVSDKQFLNPNYLTTFSMKIYPLVWKTNSWHLQKTFFLVYNCWGLWLSDITKYIPASLMHTYYGWLQITYCKHTPNPTKTNAIPLTENSKKMWWNSQITYIQVIINCSLFH